MSDDSILKGFLGIAAGMILTLPPLIWALVSEMYASTGSSIPSYLLIFESAPDLLFWVMIILGITVSVASATIYLIKEQL